MVRLSSRHGGNWKLQEETPGPARKIRRTADVMALDDERHTGEYAILSVPLPRNPDDCVRIGGRQYDRTRRIA